MSNTWYPSTPPYSSQTPPSTIQNYAFGAQTPLLLIQQRLTTLEQQWQSWQQQINTLQDQVNTLLGQLEASKNQLNAMQSKMDAQNTLLNTQKGQLDAMQAKPPVHVEYHFDQLKVSRLEGTLNIGLTPQAMSDVESFEVPVPGMWQTPPPNPQTAGVGDLQQQAMNYLDNGGRAELLRLMELHKVPVNEAQLELMLEDVRSQLNERVYYYARTAPAPEAGNEEQHQAWMASVMDKTKRDITAAFEAYLSRQQPPV